MERKEMYVRPLFSSHMVELEIGIAKDSEVQGGEGQPGVEDPGEDVSPPWELGD